MEPPTVEEHKDGQVVDGVLIKTIFPRNQAVTVLEVQNILRKNGLRWKVNNIEYYQRAFFHKSIAKKREDDGIIEENPDDEKEESNERIEFLGDSVVSFVVANYLYERFPEQNEGFLTRLKTKLVCGERLAGFAEYLKLNKYIMLSKYVDNVCHGRRSKKIMEDAFEAFIGAIYKDFSIKGTGYGIQAATWFLTNVIEKNVDFADMIMNDTNYKDQLLRYFQKIYPNGVYPIYNVISVEGPNHNRVFNVSVSNIEGEILGYGTGGSKKKAEQNASKEALVKMNIIP